MGYFNYFIKQLIRIFTRKFFWIILIFIFLTMCSIFVDNGVNAETNFNFVDNYFTNEDLQVVNNLTSNLSSSYDIWLLYRPAPNWGKCIIYYDTSALPNSCKYVSDFSSYDSVNYNGSWRLGYINVINYNEPSNYYNIGTWTCVSLYNNYTQSFNNVMTSDVISRWSMPSNVDILYMKPIKTTFNWYDNNDNIVFNATNPRFISPYIVNSNDVSSWSFDTLNISLGSISYDSNNSYYLNYEISGVDYGLELRDYYNQALGYFVVPRNQLTNNIVLRDDDYLSFSLVYRSSITVTSYELGDFTISFTTEQQDEINQDSEKFVQGQILEEQQKTNEKLDETNNKLDNIENTITDTNVDDITDNDLPSDDTEDITAEGVNGIFTSIYNAFCTGNAQDIVFPIPFTNKNITLSSSYVNDMLTNSGASWVITIIQAFWWYLISRFIIKDVMNKINKIKSGNIEDIETTNIRGDML